MTRSDFTFPTLGAIAANGRLAKLGLSGRRRARGARPRTSFFNCVSWRTSGAAGLTAEPGALAAVHAPKSA